MRELYLDHAATTPINPQVINKMQETFKRYGNPSSLHRLGIQAERELNAVRKQIATSLSCDPNEVYFTSGGTEGNNMIIKGLVEKCQHQKMRIITTQIEHPSVKGVFDFYSDHGIEVIFLDVDKNGLILIDDLKKSLTKETILVSIIGVNNEIGTIQNLKEIGAVIKSRSRRCIFHSDFVQGYMKIPLNVKECQLDSLTICAHKIEGPKGVGAIYLRKNCQLKPLLLGGGQERGLRSGTENVPGIIGFGAAITARQAVFLENFDQLMILKRLLIEKLITGIDDMLINGDAMGSPYILNVSFNRVRGEVLLHSLEGAGIYVSTGSACSAHKKEKETVLKAIHLPQEYQEGSIRISFLRTITPEEVDYLVTTISHAVNSIRMLGKAKNEKRGR